MIAHVTLAALLASSSIGAPVQEAPVHAATVANRDLFVQYGFVNPIFDISRIDLSIDALGKGQLTWQRRDVAKPQSRPVKVSEQGISEIRSLLATLNFVNSAEVYQTKEDHSNLGETRIRVEQSGAGREVVFNYTKNRDADALGRLLRGIANREMYVAELEVAILHQPLETPAVINTLLREFKLGRIGDAAALVPLLTRVAEDMALPLIARNKATELLRKIQPAK